MTDTEYSDDERYANESFENETDTDVPEMSEVESETSVNSENDDEEDDEDEDDLPSVKLNTGSIKRNSFTNVVTTVHKTDVVPFDSSSDEEDDVIVGQTMAEINTPSMHLRDESPTPSKRHLMPQFSESNERLKSVEEETQESSEEISEEEDEDEEEFKRIKDMEEKYIQLNSGKMTKETHNENDPEYQEENAEQEIDSEDESEEEQDYEDKTIDKKDSNSSTDSKLDKYYSLESLGQNNIMQLLQSSMTNLKMSATLEDNNDISLDSKTNQTNEKDDQSINTNNIEVEAIASDEENAPKSSNLSQSSSYVKVPYENEMTIEEHNEENERTEEDNKESTKESNENKDNEVVDYKDDYEEEAEIDEYENSDQVSDAGNMNYDNERDVYYDDHFDYRITSKTPTSFNSDEYIFHANFIKQFHRTSSTDKLRIKPHPRKSMSFSNERMREIERHNQILLRKILTQKPTYTTLKNKSSQFSLQKVTSQSNTRLTTSAVNRKKQQRQIDLDNQILKRKIEAIAMRRRPLIS
ncbi:hemingway [Cochliomyia hominivorax]